MNDWRRAGFLRPRRCIRKFEDRRNVPHLTLADPKREDTLSLQTETIEQSIWLYGRRCALVLSRPRRV